MSQFSPVSHVVFDCDGLLVDSEQYYSEAMTTIARKYGKEFNYQIKLDMMGESPGASLSAPIIDPL